MDSLTNLYPGWEIVGTLGTGSFGKVYKIRKSTDAEDDEYFSALKHIRIPRDDDEINQYRNEGYDEDSIRSVYFDRMNNIKKEIQLMSKLKGVTNIVSYEDHCIHPHDDGIGYDILIRMELLTPLSTYFASGSMRESDVIKLGKDICTALELCEKHQIIHRDIKPQNIFVNGNGDFKLGDFGIAKVCENTTFGTVSGSYPYMAPEIIFRQKYNASIDIYSLAMVMYWALNNRRTPFMPLPPAMPTEESFNDAQARRLSGEYLPPTLNGSEALQRIILKAASYEPTGRFVSPAEMRAELESLSSEYVPPEETIALDPYEAEQLFLTQKESKLDFSHHKASEIGKGKKEPRRRGKGFAITAAVLALIIAAMLLLMLQGSVSRTLVDEASGISVSGEISKSAVLSVEILDPEDEEYADMSDDGMQVIDLYGISLDGDHSGELSIVFPMDEAYEGKDITVVHGFGERQEIISAVSGGRKLSIECDKLGLFLLAAETPAAAPEAISTDLSEIGMISGATRQMTIMLEPVNCEHPVLTWTSSDESVVRVDDSGMLTAVKPGSAVISVSCGELMVSCSVTVSAEEIPVTGISLNRSNLNLEVSESVNLSASVAPKNATDVSLRWQSSDSGVATVSNGRVKAVSPGTTTVTVSAGGNTASCTVTVTKPKEPGKPRASEKPPADERVAISSVSLSSSAVELNVGDSARLTATVQPSNATNPTVTWKSSAPSVVSVSGSTISALSAGTATITATADGKSASCTVTVKKAEEHKAPSGYSISMSNPLSTFTSELYTDMDFYVYVSPKEADFTNITLYAIAPTGEVFTFNMGTSTSKGLNCYIPGRWQIYATITNPYGTYSGQSNGPYLSFNVLSLY